MSKLKTITQNSNLIDLNKTGENRLVFTRGGRYTVFFYNLSGEFSFDMKVSGIHLDIFGLFIGKADRQFKVHTVQNHIAPGSTSNLFIKGVFYDASKFHYEGLIRIEKKAQKSHAYQKNQNLILSNDCFVDSRPFLEILANDVFCTHGSTTGRLNKEQLNYLHLRGLSPKDAKEVLIDGFIRDIFHRVEGAGYRNEIKKYKDIFPNHSFIQ